MVRVKQAICFFFVQYMYRRSTERGRRKVPLGEKILEFIYEIYGH